MANMLYCVTDKIHCVKKEVYILFPPPLFMPFKGRELRTSFQIVLMEIYITVLCWRW
jgi:hypothetical protein